MKWQPIETAPKDETRIILGRWSEWLGSMEAWDGRWSSWGDVWTHKGRTNEMSPTHWMPLPEPPQE